jgi:hypothetical protein
MCLCRETQHGFSLHQVNHFHDLESALCPEFAFNFENIGSEEHIYPI